ncbi:MAG: translesion DNA synthesis-associated protein ImuA [Gammaproteobacteria bacterium]|nr:translesion DNA synthesis-associated protein ImuA [Gammaproteobacteria bacterium]
MNEQLRILLNNNPNLWRAGDRSSHNTGSGISTGYADLDAILPDGGWPTNALVEVITPQWGIGELQLLLPSMIAATQQNRWILWIAPPYIPYAPALVSAGVDISRLIVVRPDTTCKDALWSLEKALQNDACGIAIAWLDWISNGVVRRLQLAAQTGKTLGVLFRQREIKDSPAVVRLQLKPEFDGVQVITLKARGTCRHHSAHLSV